MIDLGSLPYSAPCAGSVAYGINNSGQVVGWSNTTVSQGTTNHAFLYSNGTMIDLGTLTTEVVASAPWLCVSEAFAINNRGQVVGTANCGAGDIEYDAFLYSGGTMIDLSALLPVRGPSQAYGINDSGQVVGWYNWTRAFLYSGGKIMDLGTLPGGSNSVACAINNTGQIVGYSDTASGAVHAFLYSNGTMIDLGKSWFPDVLDFRNDQQFCPARINNSGQVLWDGAYLYTGGANISLFDHVNLPFGPSGYSAQAINDLGQIAANYLLATDQAYLLTPGTRSQTLQIITTSLPTATGGQAYNATIAASGGSGTGYTWSLSAGSLPPGFTLSSAGVLNSTGNPSAPSNCYSFTVQVTDSTGNTAKQQLTLAVVTVTLLLGDRSGSGLATSMRATFIAQGRSLTDYAQTCGFTGFDWTQTITQSPGGVFAESAPTVSLTTPPSYADPPAGGYTYEWNDPVRYRWLSIYQPNFAKAYPFYYSPFDIPAGCAEGYAPTNQQLTLGCQLYIESDPYTLNFFDRPGNSICQATAPCIALTTQLVGICSAPSVVCNLPGPSALLYQWNWETNFNGVLNTGGFYEEGIAFFPSDSGSGTGGVTVTSINNIPVPPATATTIQTVPAGLDFTVDGGSGLTAPQTLSLSQGPHAIAVATPQLGAAGTQYVFTAWSDGTSTATDTITVGNTASTYTASFNTQYQLTTAASPSAGGSVTAKPSTPNSLYNAGAVVTLTATANPGYQFTGWTGPVANASSASTTVTMSAAQSLTANFTASTHPAFFTGEVSLGGGAYYLQFPNGSLFGYYNYPASSILYHYDMGFEAFIPSAGGSIYFYDFATGHWWYSSASLFPYLYDFTLNNWLYYFPATNNPGHYTTNPRSFSDLTTGKIITM